MRYFYEPYILRRAAEGRIIFVGSNMPFEYFVHCFQMEQPLFLVSQLGDGRLAITPNTSFIPWGTTQSGNGPTDLLPADVEYVTLKDSTYPIFITAHPVTQVDEWLHSFSRFVLAFAKQTLADFVSASHEIQPVRFEKKAWKPVRQAPAETAAR